MGLNHDKKVAKEIRANKPHRHTRKCPDSGYACAGGAEEAIAELKQEMPTVVIYIRGGAVQDIDCPAGVQVQILDFDNCPTCGGIKCQAGYIQPCPMEVK